MKKTQSQTQRANLAAMTLVELCVSLAIAAAMVTATLSATSAIARQDRLVGKMYENAADKNLLRDALAMDVLHSSSVTNIISDDDDDKTSGIELETSWSITGDDSTVSRVESLVRYEVKKIAEEDWLCRIENFDAEGENKKVKLVARGVSKLTLPDNTEDTTDSEPATQKGIVKLSATINDEPVELLLYKN